MNKYVSVGILCLATLTTAERAEAFGRKAQKLEFIQAESTVPQEQMQTLRQDMQWLTTLKQDSVSQELRSVMEVPNASPATMSGWLKNRVNFVLSGDYKPSLLNIRPYIFKRYEYPNRDQIPEIEQPAQEQQASGTNPPVIDPQKLADEEPQGEESTAEEPKAKVVMSNLGAAVYLGGKMADILIGVKVRGVGRVPVSSPRAGIIMIGEGLFDSGIFGGKLPMESPAARAFRMTTFFHEARHSDGNGKSLGFLHGLCPAGHDYENLNACDRNTNGPYTVGAVMGEHLANNCSDCSVKEQEVMRLLALDSRSRIIPARDGSAAARWDAAPEGQFPLKRK